MICLFPQPAVLAALASERKQREIQFKGSNSLFIPKKQSERMKNQKTEI